ncbi:hypothetical protein ACFXK0_27545 [Nocardia sp. NPDC059177]|uniref:hypothetical protein n=1 Tax=Nocardia sp. NPDC059177 TaxID=3346759 RepID=UPI0036BA8526
MSSIYFEPDSNLSVTDRDRRVADSSLAPLAMPGLILGLVLLGLGVVALLRLGDWAGNYGAVFVLMAYAFYVAAAARLVQWSAVAVWSSHHR